MIPSHPRTQGTNTSSATRTWRKAQELGQGSIDYIGSAVIAGLMIAGIAALPLGTTMADGIGSTICKVFHPRASGTTTAQAATITNPTLLAGAEDCPLVKKAAERKVAKEAERKTDTSGGENRADEKAGDEGASGPDGTINPQGFDGPFTEREDGFVYDKNGDRVPYSNPSNRPSYGEDQVEDVWNRDRERQLEDIENDDMEADENGFIPTELNDDEIYVLNKDGNWQSVQWKPGQNRGGKWDMGHNTGYEFRKMHTCYMTGQITTDQYLDAYRSPDHYKVEDPGRNQSHMDEHAGTSVDCSIFT